MPKYLITAKDLPGQLLFEYDDEGLLLRFENNASLNHAQLQYLATHFPLTRDLLDQLLALSKGLQCRMAEIDLTFETFWKEYSYKVGNKKRASRLWDELKEPEKLLALERIRAYNYYLSTRPNMERLYPETYLSQRRFETDYRALLKK